MIKFSFKTFIRYILMALAFSLVSMLISSCSVKAVSVGDIPAFGGGSLTFGDVEYYYNPVANGKNYYRFSVSQDVNVQAPIHMSFSFTPTFDTSEYNYFYISGFSYGAVMAANVGADFCEPYYLPSGLYESHNNANLLPSPYPFVFKCVNPGGSNTVWVGFKIHFLLQNTIQGRPYFDLDKHIMYSTESDDKSIQATIEKNLEEQQKTNDKLDDLNDNLTNSDTTESNEKANSFFENFEDKDYGLSDVITMPLTFVQKITSGTCTPLSLPLPFVKQNLTLPCMNQIYSKYFGDFLKVYQSITFGLIAYAVCINIFATIRGFKNPEEDKVEVLDL